MYWIWKIIFSALSNWYFSQYCDSNIRHLLFILYDSLFCINFAYWFMASFLYCLFYCYRYFNFRNSDIYRSFLLIKVNLSLPHPRARKSDNYCCCNNWKSGNYIGSKWEKVKCYHSNIRKINNLIVHIKALKKLFHVKSSDTIFFAPHPHTKLSSLN